MKGLLHCGSLFWLDYWLLIGQCVAFWIMYQIDDSKQARSHCLLLNAPIWYMIPSKTELPNQQFKYIEEAEKTAAVQKVLSKRQFGIRCFNIIYLFWCLRKLAIERLLSFDLKTRQLQNQFSGVNHIQSKLHCRCFRYGWSLDAIL